MALLAEKLTKVLVQEAEAAEAEAEAEPDETLASADDGSSEGADPPDRESRVGRKIAGASARSEPVETGETARDGTPRLL